MHDQNANMRIFPVQPKGMEVSRCPAQTPGQVFCLPPVALKRAHGTRLRRLMWFLFAPRFASLTMERRSAGSGLSSCSNTNSWTGLPLPVLLYSLLPVVQSAPMKRGVASSWLTHFPEPSASEATFHRTLCARGTTLKRAGRLFRTPNDCVPFGDAIRRS